MNCPKFKIIGYDKSHRKISAEWIQAQTIPDAYKVYQRKHSDADVCYMDGIQGDIFKKEGEYMSTEETTNTTKITVDDKVLDKESGKYVTAVKKEGTMSEKKEDTKKAPAKSVAKFDGTISKAAKAVKVEQKAKAAGKAIKAPAKQTVSKAKVVATKGKVVAGKAKATVKKDVVKRTGEISATTHQAGIGDMRLDSVAATKEATKKAVDALRAKDKVVRVLVRQGKFAVYYKP